MSSAGRPYTEHIFKVSEVAAGSKDFEFTIENDGAIIYVERLSGTATITGTVYNKLPSEMSDISLEDFTIADNTPYAMAHVFARQGKISVSYDDAVELKIIIKQASGSAVSQFNPSVIVIDLYDGWSAIKTTVGGITAVQVTNSGTEKSIGIRNWNSDTADILYARHTNTDIVEQGWPLAGGEGLSMDIGPGVSVWLLSDGNDIDTRILRLKNSSS